MVLAGVAFIYKGVEMIDLYKIYRTTAQRNKRTPCFQYQTMADLAKNMIFEELNAAEIIKIGTEILALEKQANVSVYQGKKIIDAVKSNNYTIDIPYMIQHRQRNEQGTIYIFTSDKFPNQVKIGATTMPINKRAQMYSSRYETPVNIFFAKKVSDAFGLERKVHDKLQPQRVRQNNPGGSIEWFHVDPLEAKKIILNKIKSLRSNV
tara:strand:+ start:288 stop:908 length:621 start_codon:yes stop_codon:yes gene_type:complete